MRRIEGALIRSSRFLSFLLSLQASPVMPILPWGSLPPSPAKHHFQCPLPLLPITARRTKKDHYREGEGGKVGILSGFSPRGISGKEEEEKKRKTDVCLLLCNTQRGLFFSWGLERQKRGQNKCIHPTSPPSHFPARHDPLRPPLLALRLTHEIKPP